MKARVKVTLLVILILEIILIGRYVFNSFQVTQQLFQCFSFMVLVSIGGFYFIRGTRLVSLLNKFEQFGICLTLGLIFSVISDQALLTTPFTPIAWLIPTILIFLGSLLLKGPIIGFNPRIYLTNTIRSLTVNWISVIAVIGNFLLLYIPWTLANPLRWDGYWKFHVDISFMESISNSFANKGFNHSYIDGNWDVKYHWFIYSFVGLLNKVGNFEPFFILTRFLPILVFFTLFPIVIGMMTRFSVKFSLSTADKLSPVAFIVGPGFAAGSYLQLRSPNTPFGIVWVLILAMLFSILMVEKKISLQEHFLMMLLSVTLVLVRASNMPLIMIGFLAIWLSAPKRIRKKTPQRVLFISSSSSVALSYILFIHGPDRPLTFQPYFGIIGFSLPILIVSAGVLLFRSTNQFGLDFKRFSIAVILAGQALSFFFYDSSGNQTYFLLSAGALALPISIAGFKQWLEREPSFATKEEVNVKTITYRSKLVTFVFIVLICSITAITWSNIESRNSALFKFYRQALPVSYCVLALLFLYTLKLRHIKKRNNLGFWKNTTVTLTFLTPFLILFLQFVNGPQYSRSDSYTFFGKPTTALKGGVSYDYVRAGQWVDAHVPKNAKFFTNRQCLADSGTENNCIGLWAYASAFSRRDFIIESYWHSGAVFPHSKNMTRLQQLSANYYGMPMYQRKSFINEFNLDWGWIDLGVNPRFEVTHNETEVYRNDKVVIIKLSS